jgi:flagellar motor switch protein FliG
MLREDMAVSGPLRLRLVEEAQQKVVASVRRLDEAGEIVIQRGDDVLV